MFKSSIVFSESVDGKQNKTAKNQKRRLVSVQMSLAGPWARPIGSSPGIQASPRTKNFPKTQQKLVQKFSDRYDISNRKIRRETEKQERMEGLLAKVIHRLGFHSSQTKEE